MGIAGLVERAVKRTSQRVCGVGERRFQCQTLVAPDGLSAAAEIRNSLSLQTGSLEGLWRAENMEGTGSPLTLVNP